jgi:uncharacterized membrane protein
MSISIFDILRYYAANLIWTGCIIGMLATIAGSIWRNKQS